MQREPRSDELMNDSNAERSLRKYKGFENAVKQMLTQEYKFLGGHFLEIE